MTTCGFIFVFSTHSLTEMWVINLHDISNVSESDVLYLWIHISTDSRHYTGC